MWNKSINLPIQIQTDKAMKLLKEQTTPALLERARRKKESSKRNKK
tara:strand:+ start:1919 stop:2056 length:138 start_codon:yes stop_codon:yes gene_type:complete